MKHTRIATVIVAGFVALALVAGGGLATAYARDGENETKNQTVHAEDENKTDDMMSDGMNGDMSSHDMTPKNKMAEIATERERAKQELKAAQEKTHAVQERLQGVKLHSCEARQSAISSIMKNAGERGDKHIGVFSKIAERVEAFYASKGKTLTGYDQFVSEVSAKKSVAQSAVDAVKAATVQLDCTGDNPKGMVSIFKAELKAEAAALKEYRQAVKNLIVGVKSVQGADASAEKGQ